MSLGRWKQFPDIDPPIWIPTGPGSSISKFISWNNETVIASARTRSNAPELSYSFAPHDYVHTLGAKENTPPDIFDILKKTSFERKEKVLERKKDAVSKHDSIPCPPKQSPPTPVESLGDDEFKLLEVFNYVSLVDGKVHAVCSWNGCLDSYTFPPEKYIVARGSEQCTSQDIWSGLQNTTNYPEASSLGYKMQYWANRSGNLTSPSQNNFIPQLSSFDDGDEEGWTSCLGYSWIYRFWPKFCSF